MGALRRILLDSPGLIRPEERSALWILAAHDEYYASALSAVRRLAEHARQDLEERVVTLYAAEQQRYLAVLEGLRLDPARTGGLRSSVQQVTALIGPDDGVPR